MTTTAKPEHFDKTFDTNARGPYFTVQKSLPGLNSGASVILVASAGNNQRPPIENLMETKPPLPPFDAESATRKVRLAEDAWNSRDPDRVVQVYTLDTRWRNRAEFPQGREQVKAFLQRKWARELDYRLIKELWGRFQV